MRARDLSKKRPGVRIKVESETEERREREIRFSSPAFLLLLPVRPTRFRENITQALSPCKTDLEEKPDCFSVYQQPY